MALNISRTLLLHNKYDEIKILHEQVWPAEGQVSHLVCINEVDQQEVQPNHRLDVSQARTKKIERMRRVALLYNPSLCLGFLLVFWAVGLRQYNANI